MSSSRKLSTDEVDALMEGLQSGVISTEGNISPEAEVRPFVFGSDDLSLLGDYYALRLINERFARLARSTFLPMLRIQPRISSFPPEVKTFDEYCSSIDGFMSLNTSRIEELKGLLLTVLHPSFISVLTNSYYGGEISVTPNQRTEFTATEERVIEIISSGLNDALEVSWRDLMPINLREQGREVNPQFTSFVDGSDLVIICSFVVQLPDIDAATFDIIYPLQTLKPIASQLRSRVQSDVIDDDLTWRDRLEKAVLDIPLHVTARLSEPTVQMPKLLNMNVGDTMPISVNEGVELLVEGTEIFEGEIGEIAGQSAVNLIKRVEKIQDNQLSNWSLGIVELMNQNANHMLAKQVNSEIVSKSQGHKLMSLNSKKKRKVYKPDIVGNYDTRNYYWYRPPNPTDPVWDHFNIRGLVPVNPLIETTGSNYFDCFSVLPKVQDSLLSTEQITDLLFPVSSTVPFLEMPI